MRSRLFPLIARGAVLGALVLSLTGAPASAGLSQNQVATRAYDPASLPAPQEPPPTAEETRDALLTVLDCYEWMYRTLPLEKTMLAQIDAARGRTLQVPDDRMKVFADEIGPEIIRLKRIAVHQRSLIREALQARKARLADGGKGGAALAEEELAAVVKSTGFPQLRTDLPEYLDGSASDNANYDSDEADAEEDAREDAGTDTDDTSQSLSALCDITVDTTTNRVDRASTSDILGFRLGLAVAQIIQMVADRICSETVLANCSVCCIPTDIVYVIVEVAHDSFMICEDAKDGAELEAAYHNTRTVWSAVSHVHNDLEGVATGVTNANNRLTTIETKVDTANSRLTTIIGGVNTLLDNTACHPVAPLVRGSGCNGNDDDCDRQVDECDEDVFGPEVHVDAAVSTVWFNSPAEAVAAVTKAVAVGGECRTYTVGAVSLTGSCGAVTASVTVTDSCGNATTVTTPVKIDASFPVATIPAAMTGTCHASVAAAEAAVRAAATISDDCTPASQLDVRIDSTVTECNLRVRIEAIDLAGKRSTAATTVRVDASRPSVRVNPLLLGFRSEVLGFQVPPCYPTVAAAEADVLRATTLSDGCSETASLTPVVTSSGDPCALRVTVSATDGCGQTSSDGIVVRVDDTVPSPVVSTAVRELSSVNHEYVDVGYSSSVTDNCPGGSSVEVRVTSDEATADEGGAGQTSKAPDAILQRDVNGVVTRVLLRAERSGNGDGRVYVIHVKATDACGRVAEATTAVSVRKSPGSAAVDSGQFYDATQVN